MKSRLIELYRPWQMRRNHSVETEFFFFISNNNNVGKKKIDEDDLRHENAVAVSWSIKRKGMPLEQSR